VHFDPECSKSTGILRPDHARADHGQRFREHGDRQDFVRIVDAWMLKRKFRRAHGRRAGRDQNLFAAQLGVGRDADGMGIDETRVALKSLNLEKTKLPFPPFAFLPDDVILMMHQIGDGGSPPE
jgi:hypothetical protein